MDNWDDLKFVLAMTRHGTMSAAARYLNTNVATVSRRIERMSNDLGVPLFEKRGQVFVATSTATRLALIAEEIDQTLRGEMDHLRREEAELSVHLEIAAPPAVHTSFMLPRMFELADVMPHVKLTLTDKAHSQGLGEADIQVRIGRPEGGRLKARKFRDYSLRVYQGEHFELNGEWIGLSQRLPESDLLRDIYLDANPIPRYRVEDMPLVHHLAKATGMPCVLPDFIVDPNDGLKPSDLPGNDLHKELWITYHETRNADAVLRSVVDWFCNAGGDATGH